MPRTLKLTRTSSAFAISCGNFTITCFNQTKFGTAPKYSTVSGKTWPPASSAYASMTDNVSPAPNSTFTANNKTRVRWSALKL